MLRSTRSVLAVIAAAAILLAGCGQAKPQADNTSGPAKVNFPTKPVTIIVPFAAGGGTDVLARMLGNAAKNTLSQPVVVENKAGGSGMVGMADGSKASPNGYTVTMVTVELVTVPHMQSVPVQGDDFKYVMRLNFDPSAITVRADSPYKTLKDFLDAAKAKPGTMKIGNSGPGAIWDLATYQLEAATGTKFVHTPYQGAGPAMTDLIGGHIDAVAVSPAEVSAQVAAGKLRILGVMSDSRWSSFPDVPTLKESGVNVSLGTWRGLAVPKSTPDAVVAILHDGFKRAMDTPEFKETFAKTGLGAGYMDGKSFGGFVKNEDERFTKLINDLGLAQKK